MKIYRYGHEIDVAGQSSEFLEYGNLLWFENEEEIEYFNKLNPNLLKLTFDKVSEYHFFFHHPIMSYWREKGENIAEDRPFFCYSYINRDVYKQPLKVILKGDVDEMSESQESEFRENNAAMIALIEEEIANLGLKYNSSLVLLDEIKRTYTEGKRFYLRVLTEDFINKLDKTINITAFKVNMMVKQDKERYFMRLIRLITEDLDKKEIKNNIKKAFVEMSMVENEVKAAAAAEEENVVDEDDSTLCNEILQCLYCANNMSLIINNEEKNKRILVKLNEKINNDLNDGKLNIDDIKAYVFLKYFLGNIYVAKKLVEYKKEIYGLSPNSVLAKYFKYENDDTTE